MFGQYNFSPSLLCSLLTHQENISRMENSYSILKMGTFAVGIDLVSVYGLRQLKLKE